MKYTRLFIALAITSIFTTSCDQSTVENETTPPTVYTPDSTSISETEEYLGLSNLIKTDTGIFRGVTFGMPAETVKSLEQPVELQEESEELLDYIVNYNFPETAEVIYYLKNNQVDRIETVVFPENKDSQKRIFEELVEYYNLRYGNSSVTEGDTIRWQSNLDNVSVLLNKKDGQKVHDIILIFKPIEIKPAKKAL